MDVLTCTQLPPPRQESLKVKVGLSLICMALYYERAAHLQNAQVWHVLTRVNKRSHSFTPQSQMLRLWVTGAVRRENGQIRTVPVRSPWNRTVAVRFFGHFYTSYDES